MATAEASLPDLDEVRPLILEGLAFAAKIAAMTPTSVDDNVIVAARDIVNGSLFGLAWGVLKRRMARLPESSESAEDVASLEQAAPEGIPIAAILAAIEMAWKLIEMLRRK